MKKNKRRARWKKKIMTLVLQHMPGEKVMGRAEMWFHLPNNLLRGNRSPKDLVSAGDGRYVRNMVRKEIIEAKRRREIENETVR